MDRDANGRKSISRYVFHINQAFSCLQEQKIVALSLDETEYMVASRCATQVIWMRKMLKSLKMEQAGPTKIYCDNKSALNCHGTLYYIEEANILI